MPSIGSPILPPELWTDIGQRLVGDEAPTIYENIQPMLCSGCGIHEVRLGLVPEHNFNEICQVLNRNVNITTLRRFLSVSHRHRSIAQHIMQRAQADHGRLYRVDITWFEDAARLLLHLSAPALQNISTLDIIWNNRARSNYPEQRAWHVDALAAMWTFIRIREDCANLRHLILHIDAARLTNYHPDGRIRLQILALVDIPGILELEELVRGMRDRHLPYELTVWNDTIGLERFLRGQPQLLIAQSAN